MVTTIRQPYKNERLFEIIKTIQKLEEPYATSVANAQDEQRSNIQAYTETMSNRGWLDKSKAGRKSVFSLNWDKIADDFYIEVTNPDKPQLERKNFTNLSEYLAYLSGVQ